MFIVHCPWMCEWLSSIVHCTSHLLLINPSILVHVQSLRACSMMVLAVWRCGSCWSWSVWFQWNLVHLYMVLSSAHSLYDLCPRYLRTTAFFQVFSGRVLKMTGWLSFNWFLSVFCWFFVDSTTVSVSPFAFNAAFTRGKSLCALYGLEYFHWAWSVKSKGSGLIHHHGKVRVLIVVLGL